MFLLIFCCFCVCRFINRNKGEVFRCRVVHSLPLRMSAIHILQGSHVVALAHLIGLDQLPKHDTIPEKRGMILVSSYSFSAARK